MARRGFPGNLIAIVKILVLPDCSCALFETTNLRKALTLTTMKHRIVNFVWLLVVVAAVTLAESVAKEEDSTKVSFENPNCLRWGEKSLKLCVKRGAKICKRWGSHKSPYCAQFEPVCEYYKVKVNKKCTQKKKMCEGFDFVHSTNCKGTRRVCSNIKHIEVRRKVIKKGKCKRFAYHEYPVCSEKQKSCFPSKLPANQCENKERKCVEQAIRKKKPVCTEYATVFRRGPKYCAKFAPKFKCLRYKAKKFCERYEIRTISHNKLYKGKIVVGRDGTKVPQKKCVQWKTYFPLVKRLKCVANWKKRVCDVRASVATEIRAGLFYPTKFKSKCLKFRYLKTSRCLKFKLVSQRICTKKVKFAERCLEYKRPVIHQKICVAFKTQFSVYCKRHAIFCKDDKQENCKATKEICKNWKMMKKPLYCLEHERIEEYKKARKAVCQFRNECFNFKNKVTKVCTQYRDKCSKYHLETKKMCIKRRQHCIRIAYKQTGKFCEMYARGPCKVNKEIKKRVCLEWKKNKIQQEPQKK